MKNPPIRACIERHAAAGRSAVRAGAFVLAASLAALGWSSVACGEARAAAISPKPAPDAKKPAPAQQALKSPADAPPGSGSGASLAEEYCRSAIEPAREARHAVQARQLEHLRSQLDERLVRIEARIVELKDWHAKRDEFSKRAIAQLIGIYGAMRPESASEQLAKMAEETAAAILAKLEARSASAILNDMPAEKAARLAGILADAARKTESSDAR